MTQLLVSVRNRVEAEAAIRGGADIIDVKEPQLGSLGRAPWENIAEVIRVAAENAKPSSVAFGELQAFSDLSTLSEIGRCRFAKIGLAAMRDADWRTKWRTFCRRLPEGVASVGVIYADSRAAESPEPMQIVHEAARNGCAGVLMDTWSKSSGSLFQHRDEQELKAVISAIQGQGMFAALAGSLKLVDIPQVCLLGADVAAVRGAVCDGPRTGQLNEARVRAAKEALQDALVR